MAKVGLAKVGFDLVITPGCLDSPRCGVARKRVLTSSDTLQKHPPTFRLNSKQNCFPVGVVRQRPSLPRKGCSPPTRPHCFFEGPFGDLDLPRSSSLCPPRPDVLWTSVRTSLQFGRARLRPIRLRPAGLFELGPFDLGQSGFFST